MMTSFFVQLASRFLFGFPVIIIALLLPCLLFRTRTSRTLNNWLTTSQSWMAGRFTNQLLSPLNVKGHKWAFLFAALMVYLITINLLCLLPYTFTATTQLSLTMGYAMPLWLGTVILELQNQPTIALGHLLPVGSPVPLFRAVIVIVTICLFIRPLALGVRLTPNLMAGHLLILLFATAVFVRMPKMPTEAISTATVLYFLTLLDVAVRMIQPFVLILLLSLYMPENIY
uniref:ATP synthase subunit a n=1 Tax=Danio albolineatus TaxID=27699 RepID=A0A140E9Z0_9TELE|nr:ATP synthase F0 subunit 6 [Danio albolineatus]AMK97353.1 ATPase subunit 6 [Danio albolineatus]